jgi:hypothetical protein
MGMTSLAWLAAPDTQLDSDLPLRLQARTARLLARATRTGGAATRRRFLQRELGRWMVATPDPTYERIGRHLLACARSTRPEPRPATLLDYCKVRLRASPGHLRQLLQGNVIDLVIDERRGVVSSSRGEWFAGDQPILFKMVHCLAAAGGLSLSLTEFFEAAWGRRFNQEYDANPLYFQVGALRRHLDELGLPGVILSDRGGYHLDQRVRIAMVPRRNPQHLGHGPDAALMLARRDGFVTSASYRRCTGVSRTTAHCILRDLVESKHLVAIGRGRSVRYGLVHFNPA